MTLIVPTQMALQTGQQRLVLSTFLPGPMSNYNAGLVFFKAVNYYTIPAGWGSSLGGSVTAATSNWTATVSHNLSGGGSTVIGTLSIAPGGTTVTFNLSSYTAVSPGDSIFIYQNTDDATLAGLTLTLVFNAQ